MAHAVVVLAAGSSSRLGEPKQLLQQNGEALLRRVVRIAATTSPQRLVVVLPPGDPSIAGVLDGIVHLPMVNPAAASGMAGSLRVAARHVQLFSRVLVLGCDQPALEVDHLSALLGGAAASSSACAATLIDGRASTPAVVPGSWFHTLRHDGAASSTDPQADQGFRQRLRALESSTVFLLQAESLALDIDTPNDLADARARGLIDPA